MNPSQLSGLLGVPLHDVSIFELAFTHKSYANEHKSVEHNERLEFLGDAVLELVITEHLFRIFPEKPEGELTKYRSALVSGASLSGIAKSLDFGNLLFLSRGEEMGGGRQKNPILANVFEAVVGAIYMDSGFSVVQEFITKNVLSRLSEVVAKKLYIDPKSAFQEWAQEKREITPEYHLLKEFGPDHEKMFRVGVFLGEEKMGEGLGTSKQKAEVAAAEDALGKNME